MRLAELSRRSGVATATIKYYLREGLLPPGRQVNATTADYDETHLRRLRLVRAMIQVGGLPVATVREVLGHVDDDSLGRTIRLGAALWALPQVPEPDEDDEFVRAAHREAGELLDRLGWSNARLLTTVSPAYRSLVVAVAAFRRLGYDWDAELLVSYAKLMHEAAKLDLDFVETHPSEAEKVETAVLGAVLVEPMLQALHRLAQEEESARRYGFE
ncbi:MULTISPECIES: MerR family transcriptional regulator [Streptomyces]|uniref:MerR family transcriptional regulator n=1 Tax=Streptomyces flaveolus TaxID=67297 RepID=A0ABV3ABE5_9ACTN|nr:MULTISPECIES: MerR family transcriptional regulator [Streptomyces]KMS78821.1 transcriptional regulator [Streptomyces regensis]KOG73337.1 transcriptional regulator [Streptomyces antibioticus]MBG7699599.1 MerR family transcriptional regulator [Streptomyces sp. MC1]